MGQFIEKFLNWDITQQALPFLLHGLLITIELALITMVTSLIFGLIAAICKISKFKVIKALSSIYINVFRATPLLVQVIIIFYALPDLGIKLPQIPAAIVALTLNNGAYVAEIIRAGIQAVPKGQMEAASSLGLNYFQAMYKIILPQAFKRSLPPLTNSFVALLKDTSLVSVIGVVEMLKQARQLQTWLANSTPLLIAAILYFLVTYPLIKVVDKLEANLKKSEN